MRKKVNLQAAGTMAGLALAHQLTLDIQLVGLGLIEATADGQVLDIIAELEPVTELVGMPTVDGLATVDGLETVDGGKLLVPTTLKLYRAKSEGFSVILLANFSIF